MSVLKSFLFFIECAEDRYTVPISADGPGNAWVILFEKWPLSLNPDSVFRITQIEEPKQ